MSAKFRKLMGIKHEGSEVNESEKLSEEQMQKQQELFQRLDQEYEMARMSTHTHRGVGLGFASATQQMPQFPKWQWNISLTNLCIILRLSWHS